MPTELRKSTNLLAWECLFSLIASTNLDLTLSGSVRPRGITEPPEAVKTRASPDPRRKRSAEMVSETVEVRSPNCRGLALTFGRSESGKLTREIRFRRVGKGG